MSNIEKSAIKLRLCKISYQFTSNVNKIDIDPDRFHKKVELKAGEFWFEIQAQKATLNYIEPPEENSNGTLYLRKLTAVFPSEKDADIELFEKLANDLLIIKLEYTDGSAKLFGDKETPVICTVAYGSGQDTEFALVFNSPSPFHSPWLSRTTNPE